MPNVAKALIVGGGIGGLAAGVALRRQGIDVDLVEIQPSWSISGVGIIQPNNALRALDRIGLAQACVNIGAPFSGWNLYDPAGGLIMQSPATSAAAPDFPPINGIPRPALHQILADAAAVSGVTVRMGVTVDAWTEDPNGVAVDFTDGSRGQYDIVIGADGIHSMLRRQLFGPSHKPQFLGQGVWRYNMPRPPSMEQGGIYFGPHSKAGLVPLSATTMYMFLVSPEPDERRYEPAEQAERMRERLDGHGGLIGELRALITDPAGVVYRPVLSFMMPAPWVKGRFVMIGDAAHASTPHLAQGAAMAIEDGVLLAELLARDDALPETLQQFMARRFERTRLVVDISAQTAGWENGEWAGTPDPAADPGGALHRATAMLMEEF